jgi:hypothetical protein
MRFPAQKHHPSSFWTFIDELIELELELKLEIVVRGFSAHYCYGGT